MFRNKNGKKNPRFVACVNKHEWQCSPV